MGIVNNLTSKIKYIFNSYYLPEMPSIVTAKDNSGASQHFFHVEHVHVLEDIKEQLGPTVALSDATTINVTYNWTLSTPHLFRKL